MSRARMTLLAGLALGSVLVGTLAACSTGPGASTGVSASASAGASTGTGGSGATSKVSANDATQAELVAALTAAGVANPQRWAREIEEYRPYDASDTTLAKLQQNLAKYNPDAATLAGILSVLQP